MGHWFFFNGIDISNVRFMGFFLSRNILYIRLSWLECLERSHSLRHWELGMHMLNNRFNFNILTDSVDWTTLIVINDGTT